MYSNMDLKSNEQCKVCGRFANRGVSVDAALIRDGKILLIKRGAEPFKGFWALPGGYVEWDESVEDAVKREVKEEVGAAVTSLKLIGVYSVPERHPKQVINIAFLVDVEGEVKAGDDATECSWFDLADLPADLAFDHQKIISEAISLS